MVLGQRGGEVYLYMTQDGQPKYMTMPLAHDWEDERQQIKDFSYDGTRTIFWRITALVILSIVLLFVLADMDYNAKRGLVLLAVFLVLALFGVTHMPDGPFHRPHPYFWRLMLVLSFVYELVLIFMLFQIKVLREHSDADPSVGARMNKILEELHESRDEARELLKHLDGELGEPLPEKEYGVHCLVYDEEHPNDPWHNMWDEMDGYMAAHFFGWWLKALILRDYWLCMVVSVVFELLEYTLEHQLPVLSECWWNHWLVDAMICNTAGIYLGMETMNYLSMKNYHWRGMWNIPSYRGKVTQVLKQVTPSVCTDFNWRPTPSLKRWVFMLLLIGIVVWAEMNLFYLEFVLWIPESHFLCLGRTICFLLWGAVALRETFQFIDDPMCKKFGTQASLVMAILITEILIVLKFDWDLITKPPPRYVWFAWAFGFFVLFLWTVWHFYLQRLLWHTEFNLKVYKDDLRWSSAKNNQKNGGDVLGKKPLCVSAGENGASSLRARSQINH